MSLKKYNSSYLKMSSELIRYLLYGVLAMILMYINEISIPVLVAGSILILAGSLYISYYKYNYKIIIEGNNLFIYLRGTMKYKFDIQKCQFNYEIVMNGPLFHSKCKLLITDGNGDKEINCTMLGKHKFEELLTGLNADKTKKVTLKVTGGD